MKLTMRYLRPYWALVLLCILLLFGQAMCDLSLPNRMSSLVNVGIQQQGLDAAAPEAISRKGQALLGYFAGEEGRLVLQEAYFTVEPESSEAQRLAKEYPLARREAVCVLRDGLGPEERQAVDRAYAQAAYGFLLYMQQAEADGEWERLAREAAQGGGLPGLSHDGFPGGEGSGFPDGPSQAGGGAPGLGADGGEAPGSVGPGETVLPDGAISSVPQSAQGGLRLDVLPLSDMPGAGEGIQPVEDAPPLWEAVEDAASGGYQEAAGEKESPAQEFFGESAAPSPGPDEAAPGAPEGQGVSGAAGLDLSEAGGLSGLTAERLYQVLPLLAFAPQESLDRAAGQAAASASMMGDQVGVALKKLFYEELGIDTGPMQEDYIWGTGLQMLGLALLGALAAVLVGLFSSRIAAAVGRRLRHDLFQKVQAMGGPEFDRFSTASLITRTTNDVQQVQMLITMGLRLVCYAPIMGVGGVVFALEKSVSMSWTVAAAVAVMLGLVAVAMALALPRFKALQGLMDRLNRISREHLSGMLVVRAFGNQAFEEGRFDEANRELADTNRFVQRVMSAMMPAMMLVMNLASITIMWVGGHAIAQSTLQIGDMMAFIQYAMQIISSFLMIAMMFVMLPRASVSAVRIGEVLDMPLAIQDPASPKALGEAKGEVAFHDVSFRYGDAESPVLEHISFTARPGETTAIIGATGAGKSTLVNLIPRFYDVTEGSITLDGVDIRELPQQALREAIGFVPQKALLFTGSIEENLRWGREDAGEAELSAAVATAQAQGFVSGLEEGLSAYVAQGGQNFSGGQRQRLAIARALLRKAPVYIFDDSFSALDFQTDAALRRALQETTAQSAMIVVAQRVGTIMHAQQILVLEDGKLAGKGTHEELLASCPAYREIAESQLQKEGTV